MTAMLLLGLDGMRRGIPAGGLELGDDEPAAGIGFVQRHATSSDKTFSILAPTTRAASPRVYLVTPGTAAWREQYARKKPHRRQRS